MFDLRHSLSVQAKVPSSVQVLVESGTGRENDRRASAIYIPK